LLVRATGGKPENVQNEIVERTNQLRGACMPHVTT
jgi:hypothetical protein